MEKEVKFKEWVFQVDFERTNEVYRNVEIGCPESCGCNNCLNFSKNREELYPLEFKELLIELGVDYKKESEIYHSHKNEKGKHFYGGWFHFKGKIKEGKDCRIEMGNGGRGLNTLKLNDDFQVGFLKEDDLSFFDKEEKSQLIQIEFYLLSDWVLDKSLESE